MSLTPDTVENARYAEFANRAYMLVDLDGHTVVIGEEQIRLRPHGAVALESYPGDTSDHVRNYRWIRPPDPDDGITVPWEHFGMTTDPRVVDLVWRFYYDLNHDLWAPGRRPSGAAGRHQRFNPTEPGSNSA